MEQEIIVKWFSEKYQIGLNRWNEAYNSSGERLSIKYHAGRIVYGERRISQRMLNNDLKVCNRVIKEYCPF